jgi:hypothetical protein
LELIQKNVPMTLPKNRQEAKLQELLARARALNVQVRKEKLLREAGYRVHSGRCRLNGQDVVIIDRDAPLADQIEFLAAELVDRQKSLAPTDTLSAVSASE